MRNFWFAWVWEGYLGCFCGISRILFQGRRGRCFEGHLGALLSCVLYQENVRKKRFWRGSATLQSLMSISLCGFW